MKTLNLEEEAFLLVGTDKKNKKIIWFEDQQPVVYDNTIPSLLESLFLIVLSCNCLLFKLNLPFDPTFIFNSVAKSDLSKADLLES